MHAVFGPFTYSRINEQCTYHTGWPFDECGETPTFHFTLNEDVGDEPKAVCAVGFYALIDEFTNRFIHAPPIVAIPVDASGDEFMLCAGDPENQFCAVCADLGDPWPEGSQAWQLTWGLMKFDVCDNHIGAAATTLRARIKQAFQPRSENNSE